MKPNSTAQQFILDQYLIVLRKMRTADWTAMNLPLGLPAAALALSVGLAGALLAAPAQAATQIFFWDTNGTTDGATDAGDGAAQGVWNNNPASPYWSLDATGNSATSYTTTTADEVHFSAGTDATGAYVVYIAGDSANADDGETIVAARGSADHSTLNGQQNIGRIYFEEGSVTLKKGAIYLGDATTLGATGNASNGNGQAFIANNSADGDALIQATLKGAASGLTIGGSGRTIFALDNLYTGATTINAGATLQIRSYQALSTGAATVLAGGTLELASGVTTYTNALTLNGTGVGGGGALRAVANDSTDVYAGAITLGSNARINSDTGTELRLTGGITGGGNSLTVGGAGDVRIMTAAMSLGAGGLVKDGTGTLFIMQNSAYTGTTTINQGIVNIGTAQALGTGAAVSGQTTVASGGSLQIRGGITLTQSLALSGTGTAGNDDGALRSVSGNNAYNGAIVLSGGLTRINADAGLLTIGGNITGAGQNLIIGGAGNTTLTGNLQTGTGTLLKDGAGTLTFANSGASGYTGNTTIREGKIVLGAAAQWTSSTIILGDGNTGGKNVELQLNYGGASTNPNKTVQVSDLGTGTATFSTGGGAGLDMNMSLNFQLGRATVFNTLNGAYTSINGVISDLDASHQVGTLLVNSANGGQGLNLYGANTFTGTVVLDQGIMALAHATAMGQSTNSLVLRGANGSANLKLNVAFNLPHSAGSGFGSNPIIDALSGYAGSTISAGNNFAGPPPEVLTLGNAGGSGVMAGTIFNGSAAVGIVKRGAGTETFSGTNSAYTGATVVTGGVMEVTKLADSGTTSSLGNSANTASNLVINGATLRYTDTVGGATVAGSSAAMANRLFSLGAAGGTLDASALNAANALQFNNTGAVNIVGNGDRTLTLAGSNTGNNTLALSLGDGTGAAASAAVTAKADRTDALNLPDYIQVPSATTVNVGDAISGPGIPPGTIVTAIDATASFNTSGYKRLLLSQRPTQSMEGVSVTFRGSSGATSLLKSGTGTWTISGNNTYTGDTTINAGRLRLDYAARDASKLSDTGALRLGGGTLELTRTAATLGTHHEVVGSTVLGANSKSTLTRTGGATGTIALGAITAQTGSALNIVTDDAAAASTLASTTTANGTDGILGGWCTMNGTDFAMNSGVAGPVGTTGNYIRAFTGFQTVADGGTIGDDGTLIWSMNDSSANNTGGPTSGNAIVLGAATTNVSRISQDQTFGGTTTIDITAGQTLRMGVTGGILMGAGTNTLTIGAAPDTGNLSAGGATSGTSGTLYLDNSSANLLTVNSRIVDNGAGAVTVAKAGSGRVVLNGTNTYTGATVVTQGVLGFDDQTALGASSTAASNLVLSGGVLQYTGAVATNSDRLFSVGTTNGGIDSSAPTSGGNRIVFNNTGAMGFNGQSGSRTLTLSGTNTNDNTLAAVIGDNGGATALVKGGGTAYAGGATGAGGTWLLSGANTYSGGTAVNDGILKAGVTSVVSGSTITSGAFGKGALVMTGTALVDLNGFDTAVGSLTGAAGNTIHLGGNTLSTGYDATDSAYSGLLDGSGGLTKTGAGVLTLGKANLYTGATTIAGGTLRAAASGTGGQAFGDLSAVTVGAAGALDLNGTNQTLGSLAGQGGTFLGNGTLTTGGNGTDTTYNGVISDGAGIGAIVKTGAGTWTINGINAYDGATTIGAGAIRIQNANSLGATGAGTTVASGAALQLDGGIAVAAEGLVLNGLGVANDGALRNISGSNTWTGAVTLIGDTRINSDAGTLTFANSGGAVGIAAGNTLNVGGDGNVTFRRTLGTLAAAGNLTKDGTGTLTIDGAAGGAGAYTGTTRVTDGTLKLVYGGADNLLAAASSLEMDGGIVQFDNLGANVQTFDDTSITASGGRLVLGAGRTSGYVDLGDMALQNTYALDVSNMGYDPAKSWVKIANAIGVLNVTTDYGITGNNGVDVLASDGDGFLYIAATDDYSREGQISTSAVTARLIETGLGTNIPGRAISLVDAANTTEIQALQNSYTAAKADPDTTILLYLTSGGSGATNYVPVADGGTGTEGVLRLGATSSSDPVNASVTSTAGTDLLIKYGTLTAGGYVTPGSAAGVGGGTIIFNSAPDAEGHGGTITVDSVIADNGLGNTVNLKKIGTGTLVLSGANTYTGTTTVNAGVLNIQDALALGAANGTTVASGGSLQLQGDIVVAGEALTLAGDGNVAGAGALRNVTGDNTWDGAITLAADARINADAGTLDLVGAVDNGGYQLTLGGAGDIGVVGAGTISGAGGLVKDGTGTAILANANAYDGATAVGAGTLVVQDDAALGSTTNGTTVASGATLALDGGVTVGAEALTLAGDGAVAGGGALRSVSGANTWGGAITLADDARINSDAGSTLDLAGTIANGGHQLTLGGAGDIDTASAISGAGGLTKDGAGTATLSGASSYSGDTTVDAGTLRAGAAAGGKAFGNLSAVTLAATGSATLDLAGFDQTIGSLAGGNAASGGVNLGTATLTTGGDNTSTTFDGRILGTTGGLTKVGTGTLILTGTSNYAGATLVDRGVLQVDGSITPSATTVDDGATLTGTGFTGAVMVASGGTLDAGTVGDSGTLHTGTLALGGTLRTDIGGTGGNDQVGVNGDVDLGGATLALNNLGHSAAAGEVLTIIDNQGGNAVTGAFGNAIAGGAIGDGTNTWKVYYDAGDGNDVVLANVAGATRLYVNDQWLVPATVDGDLETVAVETAYVGVNAAADIGTALSDYQANNGGADYAGDIVVNGGAYDALLAGGDAVTLRLVDDGAGTADTTLTDLSGDADDAIVLNEHGAGNGDLTVEQGAFAGVISGAGSLTKDGGGTLALSGDNTYTGATTVGGGSLYIDGDQSAATGLTTVQSGAILGGTGVIGGDVAVVGGTLAPGGDTTAPGTLTIKGSLALDGASTLAYQFGQAGVAGGAYNDLIVVGDSAADTLTLDGQITITQSGGGTFGPGIYRIMDYTGTLDDQTLDINASLPPGVNLADLYVQTSVAGQINLVNTAGTTLQYWDGATAASKNNNLVEGGSGVWQGSTGGGANDNWTTDTTVPAFSTNAPYSDGAFAIFTGAPGTVRVDSSTHGAVNSAGMQFLVGGYTLNGNTAADRITLTDPTVGTQRVIRVGDGTAAGGAMTATINAVIAGASATTGLEKTDLGTLVLGGANTYTGDTTVSGGTLSVTGSVASTTVAIGDGATLSVDNGAALADTAAVASAGSGALVLNDDETIGSLSGTGTVDLTGASVLTTGGAASTTYDGVIGGSGGLVKDGAGTTFTLTGANTWTGDTTIADGTLEIGGTAGTLGGGDYAGAIANDGTLLINSEADQILSGAITGGGGLTKDNTGTLTLAGTNTYAGGTTVDGGTLLVTGSITGTTAVNGGTLGGTGTTGAVTVDAGGTIAPGTTGTGILSTGALDLSLGGTYAWQASGSGATAGADYDQLQVTGAVTLNDTAILAPTSLGYTPTFGQALTIIANDGAEAVVGTFSGLANSGAVDVDGIAMRIYYNGGDGNDVLLVSQAGTPTGPLFVEDGWTAAMGVVDGDGELAGPQTGYFDLTAFDSVANLLSAYAGYSGDVFVNGGTYDALLGGGGAVTLRLVDDGAGTADTTLTDLSGDADDAIVLNEHGAGNGDLTVEQGAFDGAISGDGSLTKTTGGTLTLGGANTWTGPTTVAGGTLAVDGSTASDTTVETGATLTGAGTIAGTVDILAGGKLANAAGATLTMGDTTVDANATTVAVLGAASNPALFAVEGDLALAGKLDVDDAGTFTTSGPAPVIYHIYTYTGALTDGGFALDTAALPAGADTSRLFVQTWVAGEVNLINTNGAILNWWDGDGTSNNGAIGGDGTWSGASGGGGSTTWTDSAGLVTATKAADSYAIFAGTAGTVTVDDATPAGVPDAAGLYFQTDGYLLTGGSILLDHGGVGAYLDAASGVTATIESKLTGAEDLIETGDGTIVLAGVNDYAGAGNATVVSGGTLSVTGSIASTTVVIGDGATLFVAGGAALDDAAAVTSTGSGAFVVNADETIGSLSGTGTVDLTGASVLTTGGAASTTYDGVIGGSGGLVKDGAGTTFTLTGANTWTGDTTIADGTLEIGGTAGTLGDGDYAGAIANDGTLLVNSEADQILSGAITGFGGLTKDNTGTLTLTGTSDYAGPTAVDGGTLALDGAIASAVTVTDGGILTGDGATTGAVDIQSGGTLANDDGTTLDLGTTTVAGGATTLAGLGAASNPALFAVTGDLTLGDASSAVLTIKDLGGFSSGAAPVVYHIYTYTGALLNGDLQVDPLQANPDLIVQTAITGQVNLIDTNGAILNYWDATGASNGSVDGGTGTWFGASTGVSGSQNWTNPDGLATLYKAANSYAMFAGTAGTVTVDDATGPGVPDAAGLYFLSDGYLLTGGSINLDNGGAGSTLDAGAGMTATIESNLNGDEAVAKTGLGTIILAGSNGYAGDTTVSGGTLSVTGSIASATVNIGDGATLSVANGDALADTAAVVSAGGGAFVLAGDEEIGSLSGSGTVDLGAHTLTTGGTNASTTYAGTLSGTGGLAKEGAGTFTLSGVNDYSGDTAILGGTLEITGSLGNGDYAGDIANDGVLRYDSDASQILSGAIAGTGDLVKDGGGDLTLAGACDFDALTNNAGTLTLAGTGHFNTLANNGGTLALATTAAVTTATFIQGADGTLRLDVASAGTPLTVTGGATFAGAVVILNADTLTGQATKVLIDVGGAASGAFDQAEGTVLASSGEVDYIVSYLLGDGNDFGVTALVKSNSAAGAAVRDLMLVGQDTAQFHMDEMLDRLNRHRMFGYFEDRAAAGSAAADLARATALADGSMPPDLGEERRHSLYATATHHEFDHDIGMHGTSERLVVGYDMWVDRRTLVGAQVAAGTTEWKHGTSSGDLGDYRLSLYAQHALGHDLFVDLGGGGGYLDYGTQRGAQAADPEGWDVNGFARLVWRAVDVQENGAISRLETYGGLRGMHTCVDQYTETGPTPIAVGDQTNDLGQVFAGVNWTQWFDLSAGGASAWGYHVRLEGFLGEADARHTAELAVIGSIATPTLVSAAEEDGYGGRLTAGADFRTDGWTLSAEGSVGQGEHSRDWTARLSVSKWW